jgi:preprotein translocase subunit SecE
MVEQRSPKPPVGGSNPSSPANFFLTPSGLVSIGVVLFPQSEGAAWLQRPPNKRTALRLIPSGSSSSRTCCWGFVLAFFFANILTRLFVEIGVSQKQLISGIEFSTPPYLIGFVLAIGTGVYCWTNPRIHSLSLEVATELKRVTWPSWEETRVSTFAVVFASLVASLVLAAIDAFSLRLMVDWLPVFWEWL